MVKAVEPQLGAVSFSCPHCGALAHQSWYKVLPKSLSKNEEPMVFRYEDVKELEFGELEQHARKRAGEFLERLEKHVLTHDSHAFTQESYWEMVNFYLSRCYSCGGYAVWLRDKLLYPTTDVAIVPHEEMPDEIKEDFLEAASILEKSPRGAAALLRLCVQKLMPHIGGKGKDLNEDIAKFVQDGLEGEIQQALDIVRVTGNNAVHPGVIDLKDNRATAVGLFELLNLIVENRIARPKRIASVFERLPPGALEQIEKRDKPKS